MKKNWFYLSATSAIIAASLVSCSDSSKLKSDTPGADMKIAMNADAIQKGNEVYQRTCSPCHGAGGKGDGPAAFALNPKPQDHTNGAYMDTLTNEHIFNVIRNGGAQYGKPGMPSNPQVSDDDVRYLVAYVRSLSPTYSKKK